MVEDPVPAPERRAVVVLVTAPPERADELAGTLVGERLAACVNVVPGLRSTYRWQGEVRRDAEVLLVLKTAADLLEPLRARLAELHPYELFELVALEVSGGNRPYLDWIVASVREA